MDGKLTVGGQEAAVASPSDELLPWAMLPFTLLYQVVHRSFHVFYI